MKILIIDNEAINASKFKLVFSKYGSCDIAPGAKEGFALMGKAQKESAPYQFVTIELEAALEAKVAVAIRKWEEEKKVGKCGILIVTSEEDKQAIAPEVDSLDVNFLLKPYNRKTLEAIISEIGLKKCDTPPPPKAPEVKKPAVVVKTAEEKANAQKVKLILKKITAIINSPERITDEETPGTMVTLVKQGGKQAELLLGQFITDQNLPYPSREALFHIVGEIRSPMSLVPLNRVVDGDDNIKVAEQALMTISKYNNQRALTILTNGLKKIKNPMLLNTIRREISKIKENNPVLSILPRFLQSYKNVKNFKITVDVLKKILTPKDIGLFINYLKSGNPVIEDGTFEILCHAGDTSIQVQLFNYLDDRIARIACVGEKQCDELYIILTYIEKYFENHPSLVGEQLNEIKELYPRVLDVQAKHTLILILCRSHNQDALNYIKTIYNREENLKKYIVESLSGNHVAVDFLFEKYHDGLELKEQVVKSLLKSKPGIEYFVKHFFSFDLDKQELVIRNMPFSDAPFYMEFIRKIYETQLYSLKNYLMKVLRENFLFSFKDILFAPENQREFMFMGKDFITTITTVFPLTTLKMILTKIAGDDISTTKAKKFLAMMTSITENEPLIVFRDLKLFADLFRKIIKSNNIELNILFFSTFENLRTLDLYTHKYIMEATGQFMSTRGAAITQGEKGVATKLKQRLIDHFPDLRESQNFPKELNAVFLNKPINYEHLAKVLKSFPIAVSLDIERTISFLAPRIKKNIYMSKDDRELLFMQFPVLSKFIEYQWSLGDEKEDVEWKDIPVDRSGGNRFLENFADDFRVVLSFQDKKYVAFLKDQLMEIIPSLRQGVDAEDINDTDILICDTFKMKEYIAKNTLKTKRVYLYLEHKVDYTAFKAYNPKVFMPPFSGCRIMKMILQDLLSLH
ncbi:MAG: hypothetical protein GY765_29995 [bacterium]|nr:hypothetical protein [bacterium]